MKKRAKRTLIAIICATILATSLSSCGQAGDKIEANTSGTVNKTPIVQQDTQNSGTSDKDTAQIPTISPSVNDSVENNDIEKDKYEEQIKYYMELTESLRAEILALKEQSYIDEAQYQLEIATLEETLQNLKQTIATLTGEQNRIPVSGNTPSNDKVVLHSDFKYEIKDGGLTITGYQGTDIDVTIPSSIDGYPVTEIGEGAFKNLLIRSISIPSSVRSIDWFAFSGCTCLEIITSPSSVLSIGYGAFDYCPDSMTVTCSKGSYAEAFALSWGMKIKTS